MPTTPTPSQALDTVLFKALLEKATDAIYFKDAEGRFLRVSNRMVGAFNRDHPSQVEGKTAAEFYSEDHIKEVKAAEAKIMQTGLPMLDVEEAETWPDGSITWASTSKFPLYDTEGALIGTFGISRDITEHKIAEEELQDANNRLIEEGRKSAVAEFAGTVLANMGGSIIEIRQGIDRALTLLQQARTNPEALAKATEEVRELRYVAQTLSDLMKIQSS